VQATQPIPRFSQQQLAQVFDAMPSGLILLDLQGFIAKANTAAKHLLGHELEQSRWASLIPVLFSPQADDGHELSLHDGRRVQLSLSALEDGSQLIVLTDVTATRQLQSNIARLEKLSALGRMVASLAHQIRTPLSAAMLYGSNLANRTLSPGSRDSFQKKMMARLVDLETQVNDMLLFARGGEQMVVDPVSVTNLLDNLKTSLEAKFIQKNLTLRVEHCDPDVLVMANCNSLVSALGNLLDNAAQVSPSGSRVRLKAQADDKKVDISVIDAGPGLSPEALKQIFEPFYTTKQNGTGLGLAVVKTVAKAHNGEVAVFSQSGQGCCFRVTLPVYQVCQRVEAHVEAVGE
jgi:two-component system sensor histidine kinase FlrB